MQTRETKASGSMIMSPMTGGAGVRPFRRDERVLTAGFNNPNGLISGLCAYPEFVAMPRPDLVSIEWSLTLILTL